MLPESPVTHRTYLGLFLVALATLMYEILLTRVFSVTMLYHFAFVAISVAMFGMTVGALLVYLLPGVFRPSTVSRDLAAASIAFPILLVFSFLTELSIPFRIHPSVVAIYAVVLTYAVIAVPFVASGVVVALALSRFPRRVHRLYAADLAGAALGCLILAPALNLTDAPTVVLVIATLAAAGGVAFSSASGSRRLRRLALVSTAALVVFTAANAVLVAKHFPLFRILYIRGTFEARPLYEKWNSYSRVRVNGDPNQSIVPTGWGLSNRMPSDLRTHQLQMDIDVTAGTVMTGFDGDLSRLRHLRYDVTNIGYWLKTKPEVLVVGAGGGRDVLSALAFGARHVTAVELNKDVIRTVNGRFGDFTGHLDRRPDVTFANDEARSYIARQQQKFDLIQISLIDTWAATAAGAFVLSENSLYTSEAWNIFVRHLSDDGMLSVSRWYFRDRPAELYRVATLATTALASVGARPRDHVVIVRNMQVANRPELPDGVGTLLVKRTPFSAAELDALDARAADLGFEVVLSPRVAGDPLFQRLLDPAEMEAAARSYQVDITPPSDDSPFFFNMLRMRDVTNWRLLDFGKQSHNMKAVFVLVLLLATVVLLSALCIFAPLWIGGNRAALQGSGALLVYFAALGLGFMLVETSQMQRLIIVLGHPTYGLTVVLFTLLLSSGIGSMFSGRVSASPAAARSVMLILLAVLIVVGLGTPAAVRMFEGSSTAVRIGVAGVLLAPPGFLMGMGFPIGMAAAVRRSPELVPWLWGVNGAMSVVASVAGVCLALASSISTAFYAGCAAYLLATIAYWTVSERTVRETADVPAASRRTAIGS